MASASRAPTTARDPSPDTLREAFHELHGRRLHGFALLLTLGDRRLAARLTADALADGAGRFDELRHPERAAAWLRARVRRAMPRSGRPVPPSEERAALEPLDVEPAVVDGLAALGRRDRAALIVADVERLDRHDVETVAGRSGASLERLLERARRRYLDAYASAPRADGHTDGHTGGLLVRRIRSVAARTMS